MRLISGDLESRVDQRRKSQTRSRDFLGRAQCKYSAYVQCDRGFNNTSLFPCSLQLPPLISLLPAWYIDRPTSTAAARPAPTYVGALVRARAFLCVRVLRFIVSRYAHFHVRMYKPISLFLSHSASCIPLGETIY